MLINTSYVSEELNYRDKSIHKVFEFDKDVRRKLFEENNVNNGLISLTMM